MGRITDISNILTPQVLKPEYNFANIIGTDALATQGARASVAMVLGIQVK